MRGAISSRQIQGLPLILTNRSALTGLIISLLLALALSCGKDNPASPNTPPVASFIVSSTSGTTETVFLFDASGCSDAEDSTYALQVRWDFENDGIWDTQWSTTKVSNHKYSTSGAKTVKLEVKDTDALISSTTRTLSCGNAAPRASLTVNTAVGTTQTVFLFDASGCSDAEDPVDSLELRWDFESDGVYDIDWGTTFRRVGHQYATTGVKITRLEVRDTEGLTDDTTYAVTVEAFVPGMMVLVPSGAFTMGDGASYCGVDEREVVLTHPFRLGKYEVTNKEYRDALQWAYDHNYVSATSFEVTDNLDGSTALLVDLSSPFCEISFSGEIFTVDAGLDNYPMVEVSWYGAAAYCDWLSMQEGLQRSYNHAGDRAGWRCNGLDPYGAEGYRLPTDAEWEYAAQWDDERVYPWGDEPLYKCGQANWARGCNWGTTIVGTYAAAPAALGLCDMAGNVWEWCNDWRVRDLGVAPVTDPPGPTTSPDTFRVLHGGAWIIFDKEYLRCAARCGYVPGYTGNETGFRIAQSQ